MKALFRTLDGCEKIREISRPLELYRVPLAQKPLLSATPHPPTFFKIDTRNFRLHTTNIENQEYEVEYWEEYIDEIDWKKKYQKLKADILYETNRLKWCFEHEDRVLREQEIQP